MGQEIFNAAILGVAVADARVAQHLDGEARRRARRQRARRRRRREERPASVSVLSPWSALAVLREGSETVLFLYGVAARRRRRVWRMLIGAVGRHARRRRRRRPAVRGPPAHPAAVVLHRDRPWCCFLAAGMASQAARFLIQADMLPGLAARLWDTSADGRPTPRRRLLRGLVGYDARPAGMQMMFFAVVFVAIVAGMAWTRRRTRPLPRTPSHGSCSPAASQPSPDACRQSASSPPPSCYPGSPSRSQRLPLRAHGRVTASARSISSTGTDRLKDDAGRESAASLGFGLGRDADWWFTEAYVMFTQGGRRHDALRRLRVGEQVPAHTRPAAIRSTWASSRRSRCRRSTRRRATSCASGPLFQGDTGLRAVERQRALHARRRTRSTTPTSRT